MNGFPNKIITRIIIAARAEACNDDNIIITIDDNSSIILKKTTYIGGINIYDLSCNIINTDSIYWESSMVTSYGSPITICLLEDDIGYNHVNDLVYNYCQPEQNEDMYSVFRDRGIAVTIFCCDIGG